MRLLRTIIALLLACILPAMGPAPGSTGNKSPQIIQNRGLAPFIRCPPGSESIPPGTFQYINTCAPSGQLVLTLPPASGYTGSANELTVIDTSGLLTPTNNIALAPSPNSGGSDTIAGSTSTQAALLSSQSGINAWITLRSDGLSNWSVVSRSGDLQIFSVHGSFTWLRPLGVQNVAAIWCGSGGSGGGGARQVSGSSTAGGGGGAGGGCLKGHFSATDLGASVAVSVATGATGGAAAAADSSPGSPGTNGQGTTFNGLLAAGGGGGAGGTAGGNGGAGGGGGCGSIQGSNTNNSTGGPGCAGNAGGANNASAIIDVSGALSGGGGAGGTVAIAPSGISGANAMDGPGGGGAGGGINVNAPQQSGAGGNGSGGLTGVNSIGCSGGASRSGGSGSAGNPATQTLLYLPGCGGGGGGSSITGGGAGGNGTNGGGGGGGASTRNTFTAGAGGNGGDGFAAVRSW